MIGAPHEVLRCGSSRVALDPPPGLPMVGFVRQSEVASGYGCPLEATALVVESAGARVAILGVDTLGIQAPEVDQLRRRIADELRIDVANVVLNWSHTHLAPPAGRSLIEGLGQVDDDDLRSRCEAYIDVVHDRLVAVALEAAASSEPARVVWGLGRSAEAVNRRERTPDGRVILGWHADGIVDPSVAVLQARRPDESVVCTLVSFGCHPVASGPDVLCYSADFPGALRAAVREWTKGECVFFQGAAGNVLPLIAFTESEAEAMRLGRAIALEALHAVAGRRAWPARISRSAGGSVTPFSLYRRELADAPAQGLSVASATVTFPLLPLPSRDEISTLRAEFGAAVAAAEAAGAGTGVLRTLRYHSRWAEQTESSIVSGSAPDSVDAVVTAIRIGDGVLVCAPGEIFGEIGLAVKERSAADVTVVGGYSNGLVSYFPTAAEYPFGGYEPGYGNRTFGLPSQVAPECERVLVETGVRLVAELFPERRMRDIPGWLATGTLPSETAPERPRHPDLASEVTR